MRLVLVAMSESIHTARWISQIADQGWDIHLFPCVDYRVTHPEIRNVTVYHSFYDKKETKTNKSVKFKGCQLYSQSLAGLARKVLNKFFPEYREVQLKKLIKRLQPDIIHSLEFQHSAYLTLNVKKYFHNSFPPWIVTNWGSDIYLFGRLSEHEQKIKEVLKECDYYSCECYRDVGLAEQFGFKGRVLPVFPNAGGFDLKLISGFRENGPTSNRRVIMLKGYQTWSGRALVGIRALEKCADMLEGYEIAIYSADDPVLIAAELFQRKTGIPVTIIPPKTSHDEILKYHGKSRISIGLGISDAISTSFLEALVMGAFPIQSWTSCADEWIENGKNGILVPPEDPEVVEQAIRRALEDDELVNQAAEKNYQLTAERLDRSKLRPKSIELYKSVLKEEGALIEK